MSLLILSSINEAQVYGVKRLTLSFLSKQLTNALLKGIMAY